MLNEVDASSRLHYWPRGRRIASPRATRARLSTSLPMQPSWHWAASHGKNTLRVPRVGFTSSCRRNTVRLVACRSRTIRTGVNAVAEPALLRRFAFSRPIPRRRPSPAAGIPGHADQASTPYSLRSSTRRLHRSQSLARSSGAEFQHAARHPPGFNPRGDGGRPGRIPSPRGGLDQVATVLSIADLMDPYKLQPLKLRRPRGLSDWASSSNQSIRSNWSPR